LKLCSICDLKIILACQIKRKIIDNEEYLKSQIKAKITENSCRVCLAHNSWSYKELFSPEGNLILNITNITGYQISKDDQLPKKICSICDHKVVIACQIRKKILDNEKLNTKLHQDPATDKFFEDFPDISDNHSVTSIDDIDFKFPEKPVANDKYAKPSELKIKRPTQSDFKCFICDKIFKKVYDRQNHVKQAHKDDSKVCPICKKQKHTAASFENHIRDHFIEPRFICSHCGTKFHFKARLNQHMRFHNSTFREACYSCDLCEFETKFKTNLFRHMTGLHMKRKNYVCTFSNCPAKYATQYSLKQHLYRRHQVEPPVSCPHCGQGFTLMSQVKFHMSQCTGSKRDKRPQMHNRMSNELAPKVYIRKPRQRKKLKNFNLKK
jgi:Zinc-finger associated domain (zf-AD)